MSANLLERLESLPTMSRIPRPELEWLARHGSLEILEPGLIYPERSDLGPYRPGCRSQGRQYRSDQRKYYRFAAVFPVDGAARGSLRL